MQYVDMWSGLEPVRRLTDAERALLVKAALVGFTRWTLQMPGDTDRVWIWKSRSPVSAKSGWILLENIDAWE